MAELSGISWTDHTFNIAWGCSKVSPACDHCYAERDAVRYGYSESGKHFPIWGPKTQRRLFSDSHWEQPVKWNKRAQNDPAFGRFVFTSSMADIFEDHPEMEAPRQRLWKLIEETPHLVWMLTTKRAQNIAKMLPEHWMTVPRHNIILMVTVESQAYDWRIDKMLEVPAVCYAVSAEPLLGPLDLRKYLQGDRRVNWVIAGGESGYAEARPTRTEWFRDLRDHAEAAGAIYHFKQHGAWIAVDPPITNDKGIQYIVCPDDLLRQVDYLLEAGRLRNEGTEWFYRTSEGVKWKDNLLDGKQHLGRPEWPRY